MKINKALTTMRSSRDRKRAAHSLKLPRISSRLFGSDAQAFVYHDTWEAQAKEEVYRRRAGCRYMCTTEVSVPPQTWVTNLHGGESDFGEVLEGQDVGKTIFASGVAWKYTWGCQGDATLFKRLLHKRMPHMY